MVEVDADAYSHVRHDAVDGSALRLRVSSKQSRAKGHEDDGDDRGISAHRALACARAEPVRGAPSGELRRESSAPQGPVTAQYGGRGETASNGFLVRPRYFVVSYGMSRADSADSSCGVLAIGQAVWQIGNVDEYRECACRRR